MRAALADPNSSERPVLLKVMNVVIAKKIGTNDRITLGTLFASLRK